MDATSPSRSYLLNGGHPACSIAVRLRRRCLHLLDASPGVGFVVSHNPLPEHAIEQIGIDHVGMFEVEAFGRLRPPRAVVERFDRGSYGPVSGVLAFRYERRVD